MKKSILYTFSTLLFIFNFGIMTMAQQSEPYSSQWKLVEKHLNAGLPKSALVVVNEIYAKAKEERQKAQQIKALVYQIDLQNENTEHNDARALISLETELEKSQEPERSILSSLLAKKYWNYYQQIRWQLYDRSQTTSFDKADVATWSTDDFHEKIGALYLQSIRSEQILKQTPLKDYEAIIIPGNTRTLRPTLYDLLTHSALQYFQRGDGDIRKPAYAFEINSAAAMDPAADFVTRKFETRDSSSLQFYALQLYQRLIAFHLQDEQPDALIDLDLQRLQYVRDHSVHPDKESQYFLAINHIAHQYRSTPAAAQAWYLMANWYYERGSQYQAGKDSTFQQEKNKAKKIAQRVVEENPQTEGGINAWNLLQTIQLKSLIFSTENVNIPEQPFRMLVGYQNLSKIYFRIYEATEDFDLENTYQSRNNFWDVVSKKKPLKSWTQPVPDTKDHQQHRVETKVDGLPIGEYILLASSTEHFEKTTSLLAARKTHISNISFIQQDNDLFTLDRDSGQPLTKAKVQVWEKRYNNSQQKYDLQDAGTYLSDANGRVPMRPLEGRYQNNTTIEITHKKDHLHLESPIRTFLYQDAVTQNEKRRTWLFTDRSLYRPGQTVYYKGIVAQGQNLFTDTEAEIALILQGANAEEIEKRMVRVNAYGSFSGKFQLPLGTLNGTFTIEIDGRQNISFQVEEYKRPKFEVSLDTLQGTYKLDQTVTVTGKAQAYAGNAIDAAQVIYRIERSQRFLYPWMFSRWWYPQEEPMEIGHGTLTTDEKGLFKINFEAIPDRNLSIKSDPIFNYTIYVDVTDGSGETRSTQQQVSIGYKSLVLEAGLTDKMDPKNLEKVKIRTENLNGAFVPATVEVKISRLIPEARLIRPRLWEKPDQFILSKEGYIQLFPHDEYDQESEPEHWQVGNIVLEKQFDISENKTIDLSDRSLRSGYFKVEFIASDSTKQQTKLTRYIQVLDVDQLSPTAPQYLSAIGSESILPGEQTNIKISTAASDVFLIKQNNKGISKGVNFEYPALKKGLNIFEFSASEADRGGYGVSFSFVKHNRLFTFSETIDIPWSNKELTISYQSFRDKTLPGSSEQWKVKISGDKKDGVAAEMLASMYDVSLDQFFPHAWTKPGLWPTKRPLTAWNSGNNFSAQQATPHYTNPNPYKPTSKAYDNLIEFQVNRPKFFKGMVRRNVGAQLESATGVVMDMAMEINTAGSVDADLASRQDSVLSTSQRQTTPASNPVRTNFNETAFFIPDLHTNENGEITFSFTLPDALTRWKFQALAHTKELAFGYSTKEIVTQKQLMVQPNPPRFVRQGDKLVFSTKVVNLSDQPMEGTVGLAISNPATDKNLDQIFKNVQSKQPFTIKAGQSKTVLFPIEIPADYLELFTWHIDATAGSHSDAEQQSIPVLSSRLLVTESLPLSMTGKGKKNINFDKLLQSGGSKSITHQGITIEYTSNPAWYAIQALPYLMEYPYDCAEQTWNRYYANSLAASVVQRSPKIAAVFQTWQKSDTSALLSNLEKNQELKSILLEETPWILAAKSQTEQKKNIALLFDLIRMRNELSNSLDKLRQKQLSSGGFAWFDGGREDRYMTQYILTGIGHLQKAKAIQPQHTDILQDIVGRALPYLDLLIEKDYEELTAKKLDLKKIAPTPTILYYLYMRSFFTEIPIPNSAKEAYQYFIDRAKTNWVDQSKYMQGLTALALHRTGDQNTPKAILKSLKQTAIQHQEMGMYWKTDQRGWWWYEAPVERQALLVEAFQEIEGDAKIVNALKTWLLKNKQTNHWESTKATAEACYALISEGSNWLASDATAEVKLGTLTVTPSIAEAGTGYFKTSIAGAKVTPDMGRISINIQDRPAEDSPPSWGAVYWQYFEEMDKITFAQTPLKLTKDLFVEKNTDRGPVLIPVNDQDMVQIGDKIKVRILLEVDRDMEYVHMKDLRASTLEPLNVISSFKYQGGLGYYESTKDASTNFFFNSLRKGTYVFEYPLHVTHAGDFSNGITSIQCMYAPEFTAHSKGVRMLVK